VAWLTAIFKAVLEWLAADFRRPRTLEDANTPDDLRRRWAAALRERLRDKNGGH
jgi:hypothetical protein